MSQQNLWMPITTTTCGTTTCTRRAGCLQSSSAGLLDVALDIPLPIYYSSGVVSSAIFPLRRLLIILMTAVIVGLVRRTLFPKVLGFLGGIRPTDAPTAVPPLETYTTTKSPKATDGMTILSSSLVVGDEVDTDTLDDKYLDNDSYDGKDMETTAMLFEDEGWGQARFLSKEKLPDSTLIKLSFQLPRESDYLPLAFGEKIRICCMGQNDTTMVSEIYPYGDTSSGQFSFLVEDPSLSEDEEHAELIQTILSEFQTGDELAIQPVPPEDDDVLERISPWYLAQNNIQTIVYWANGAGIAPAMDHLRIILDRTKSVKTVNFLWVNTALSDFEYAQGDLEKEYELHGDRLAISCVAWDAPSASDEINEALVPYQTGMMALLTGPRKYTADAAQFLIDSKGFPDEAICIL